MKTLLYQIVILLSRIHAWILSLNDKYQINLNDKQLHFLTIGIVGLVLTMVLLPVFRSLAEKKRYLTLTFIYVMTVMIVLTFAIEIGQGISGTGVMEMGDITSGLAGYLMMFFCFAIVYLLIQMLTKHTRKH